MRYSSGPIVTVSLSKYVQFKKYKYSHPARHKIPAEIVAIPSYISTLFQHLMRLSNRTITKYIARYRSGPPLAQFLGPNCYLIRVRRARAANKYIHGRSSACPVTRYSPLHMFSSGYPVTRYRTCGRNAFRLL
ncbi:hypothetical protein FIBSPDRAFT_427377 [Athelia psychrophila]|uniref:Uncharacterized protein n=1 Tax=Athelia psychrophila TaxID=1759441 RepID=A0A166MSP9_9AGAM|nr:hypothetical protein FIBSPDRAFT_427377 [Fibularhizoctonia sp. CBS 109695]